MGACTDSMVAFALFLSHLGGDSCRNGSIGTGMDTSKGSHNGCNHQDNRATVLRSPDWLRRAMDSTIAVICEVSAARGVNEISLLNFVLADGRTLVASCHVREPEALYQRSCCSEELDGDDCQDWEANHFQCRVSNCGSDFCERQRYQSAQP